MIHHGHIEPLVITLKGETLKDGSPTKKPCTFELLNQSPIPVKLRKRLKSEFIMLVFDNESADTKRAYLKLYKLIRDMDKRAEFTKKITVATIDPTDHDLATLDIFDPDGFAYYLTDPKIIKARPIKIHIIYCVGLDHMDSCLNFESFPDKVNEVYRRAFDLPGNIDWCTEMSLDIIYKPQVSVKGITDIIEL